MAGNGSASAPSRRWKSAVHGATDRRLAPLPGKERWIHPLIAMAAFNLDLLCIHPFRDGNGRVSRLILLLQCRQQGFEVGRYISLERLIEQNKERYYEGRADSYDFFWKDIDS